MMQLEKSISASGPLRQYLPGSVTSAETGNDLISLQLVRAIAAWMVVFHHYMQHVHGFVATNTVERFFAKEGSFGVDLFFVLSGVVMCFSVHQRDSSVDSFLIRRFLRIFPTYWCATAIALSVGSLVYVYGVSAQTPRFLAGSLLLIPTEHPSGIGIYPLLTVGWTLSFELVFYALIGILLPLRRIDFNLWISAGIFMVLVGNLVFPRDWIFGSVFGNAKFREFAIGLALGAVYLRVPRRVGGVALPFVAMMSVLFAVWAFRNPVSILGQAKLLSPAGFIFAAMCMEKNLRIIRLTRPVSRLGDISYSTYLLHPLIIAIILAIFGPPASVAGEFFMLMAVTVMTILFSEISYRLVETHDWLRLFRQVKCR